MNTLQAEQKEILEKLKAPKASNSPPKANLNSPKKPPELESIQEKPAEKKETPTEPENKEPGQDLLPPKFNYIPNAITLEKMIMKVADNFA